MKPKRTPSRSQSPARTGSREEDHTYTPSPPEGIQLDQEALDALEWSRILDFLASLCRTAEGVERAHALPFLETQSEIERELEQVAEALTLLQERGEAMPMGNVPHLHSACHRIAKGGSLEAPDLLEFANTLEVVANTRRWLLNFRVELPKLWERGELLDPLQGLRKEIQRAIDSSGQLRDDASWELGTLRQEVRICHDRLKRKLQNYISGPQSQSLTDTYYTLREDRYVLPVKASEKSRFPGIVYGSSSSGQTIYIEPQPLIELNNSLRMAESEVQQEEARILARLSQQTAKALPQIRSNLLLLRDLDLLQARVRFAQELQATIPQLTPPSPDATFHLKQARHPLLILKGIQVVPNDLILGGVKRNLLLSGPNTGGKTVSLKTIGLCALMARAALPIPADAESQVPLVRNLFTDIGDRQSIEQDLSTFSAQVLKLRAILERADDQTLVLIDEIVVGTDPQQGSCLAIAILQELAGCGAFTAVTSHYEALKALPYEDERFENACVGFDLQRLAPTYRVYIGTPGGSNALQIARRLGMPEEVCQRVEEMLSESTDRFEHIVSRLEQQYQELYEERDRATRARQRVEKQQLSLQKREDELERLRDRLLQGETESLNKALRDAREELRETIVTLQRAQTSPEWKDIHRAERRLQKVERTTKEVVQEVEKKRNPAPPKAHDLQVGQKVKVLSLKSSGELLSLPDQNDQVQVQVGRMRVRVPLTEIKITSDKPAKAPKTKAHNPSPKHNKKTQHKQTKNNTEEDFPAIPTKQNSCDLRGLTVEEALQTAEAFLDELFKQEQHVAYLIHGHGTGALRKAIRQYCRQSSYIQHYRPGERAEGGNGVTVAQLAQ